MKAIKRLITGIIVFLLLIAFVIVGGYIYIRSSYGIDLIKTVGQFKTLSETVDESSLCPNSFDESDMLDVQNEVNKSAENLITYTEENGYSVNFDSLPAEMKYIIKLSDKQVGALADTVVVQEMDGKISLEEKYVGLKVKQVDFSLITESDVLFNTVVCLDVKSLKDDMQGFPLNYLRNYIPDNFYISSTVKVTKGSKNFSYSVTHSSLTVNNLTKDDTEDLFHTLDVVFNIGSAKDLNVQVGSALLGTLIGSDTQNGLAYSLKDIGAKDYVFLSESGLEYFAVVRDADLLSLLSSSAAGHAHTMERIEKSQSTCAGDELTYWHCTGCNKNYADENGTSELKSVSVDESGHLSVIMYDSEGHWLECNYCQTKLEDKQPHKADEFLYVKAGHYKVCTDCGAIFAAEEHTGEPCSVCGFVFDYKSLCASDYGYNYLSNLTNGDNYCKFYERLDDMASAFHDDDTKTAQSVSVSGGNVVYVAGNIKYSDLELSSDEAVCVWSTYRNDHPLYYWISGSVVYDSLNLSLCVVSDFYNGSARKTQNEEIHNAIENILDAVSGETSSYQIALAFHDIIIDSIDYARDEHGNPVSESWAHSVLGVFSRGQAVCEGYAKAFSLLLNACGVDNVFVTGTSNGEGHAWNLVEIEEGKWYWYDLTWDDQPSVGNGIIYTYLCKCESEFENHTVGETGVINNPSAFLYEIPTAATTAYDSSLFEYGEEFKTGGLTYKICGYDKVSLIGADETISGNVTLSGSVVIDGRTYALTEIGDSAFKNNKKITVITVPSSVCVIYNFAFYDSSLYRATFEDKEGWSRTSSCGTESISSESLKEPISAATLLKGYYVSGGYNYQYVWKKTVAE